MILEQTVCRKDVGAIAQCHRAFIMRIVTISSCAYQFSAFESSLWSASLSPSASCQLPKSCTCKHVSHVSCMCAHDEGTEACMQGSKGIISAADAAGETWGNTSAPVAKLNRLLCILS